MLHLVNLVLNIAIHFYVELPIHGQFHIIIAGYVTRPCINMQHAIQYRKLVAKIVSMRDAEVTIIFVFLVCKTMEK